MVHQPLESPELDIAVDRDAEIPIGVQLAWALRSRIGDGRFTPGQRLPGLREVAEATGVNVNTVRTVYQRLEHEGLISSQQGSGTFVTDTPQRPSSVAAIAADAAREAHETGVDPRAVAAALYVSPDAPPAPNEATERRRTLRQQIAALERTLGELEAKHPTVVAPAAPTPPDGRGPTLLDVTQLEQVRTQLVRRLTDVQAAIDRLAGNDAVVLAQEQPPAAPPVAAPAAMSAPAPAPPRRRSSRVRPTARPASEGA